MCRELQAPRMGGRLCDCHCSVGGRGAGLVLLHYTRDCSVTALLHWRTQMLSVVMPRVEIVCDSLAASGLSAALPACPKLQSVRCALRQPHLVLTSAVSRMASSWCAWPTGHVQVWHGCDVSCCCSHTKAVQQQLQLWCRSWLSSALLLDLSHVCFCARPRQCGPPLLHPTSLMTF